MAEQYGTDFLGDVPLDISVRESVDNGRPTVVADPDGAMTANYKKLARNAAAKLAMRKKDFSSKFPNIVIQQN